MLKRRSKRGSRIRPRSRELKEEESRFFKAIHDEDGEAIGCFLQDTELMAHLEETDKISLAFMQVILLNSVRLLKIFVDHGIDIHSPDSFSQENGIMHAARYGHLEMMECLLGYGVGINYQSENGSTALHVAVENKKHEAVEFLVKQKGIDLNIKDCSGYSPLLWSARLRDWEAMKILIDAGCNIESVDFNKGVNALHIVVDKERAHWKGKSATPQDYIKCIDVCVNGNIDMNKGDIYGNTPLVYAVKCNHVTAVKHLLRLNCSLDKCPVVYTADLPFSLQNMLTQENCSLYPLYLAISRFQISIVKSLCAAGVKYHLLGSEPGVFMFLDQNFQTLKSVLEQLVFNPMTLKQTARNVIRRALPGDIPTAAPDLHLPTTVYNYLCLEDINKL